MKIPILSINGSDSSGQSGIGADIQTIAALGGYAVSAVTCIGDYTLPSDVVLKQAEKSISTLHPKAIKAGLVTDSETVRMLHDEVIACRRLVVAPGIYDAEGRQMVSDDVIEAIARYLVPEALLLMLRCRDAEKMLGISIRIDDDMLDAARRLHEMGAEWVLLRGARHIKGRLIALLYGQNKTQFFSSYNTEGWQKHGVGGTLSAAIATRLAFGDTLKEAISKAHDYMHAQVVFGVKTVKANRKEITERSLQRKADIYNEFMTLIAQYYREAHDVAFYADKLALTTRYLSKVTTDVVDSSPKQLIFNYIMQEACSLLRTSRLSMSEISAQLGFSSESRFVTLFRKQKGMSPGEWRRKSNH